GHGRSRQTGTDGGEVRGGVDDVIVEFTRGVAGGTGGPDAKDGQAVVVVIEKAVDKVGELFLGGLVAGFEECLKDGSGNDRGCRRGDGREDDGGGSDSERRG